MFLSICRSKVNRGDGGQTRSKKRGSSVGGIPIGRKRKYIKRMKEKVKGKGKKKKLIDWNHRVNRSLWKVRQTLELRHDHPAGRD